MKGKQERRISCWFSLGVLWLLSLRELRSSPSPRMAAALSGGSLVFAFTLGIISWLSMEILQLSALASGPASVDSPSCSWSLHFLEQPFSLPWNTPRRANADSLWNIAMGSKPSAVALGSVACTLHSVVFSADLTNFCVHIKSVSLANMDYCTQMLTQEMLLSLHFSPWFSLQSKPLYTRSQIVEATRDLLSPSVLALNKPFSFH